MVYLPDKSFEIEKLSFWEPILPNDAFNDAPCSRKIQLELISCTANIIIIIRGTRFVRKMLFFAFGYSFLPFCDTHFVADGTFW